MSGILKVLYAIEYGDIFIKGKARILICENCKAQIAIYRTMCNFIYFPRKKKKVLVLYFRLKTWETISDLLFKTIGANQGGAGGWQGKAFISTVRGNVTVPFTIVSGYVIWEQFFVPGRKRKGNSENHKWKRITDLM